MRIINNLNKILIYYLIIVFNLLKKKSIYYYYLYLSFIFCKFLKIYLNSTNIKNIKSYFIY